MHSERPSYTVGAILKNSLFKILFRAKINYQQLTPNEVSDSTNENIRATSLNATTVWIKIYGKKTLLINDIVNKPHFAA